jgi:hypothetical protein
MVITESKTSAFASPMVQMLQTVVSIINGRCICSKSTANALFQVVILCESSQPKSQRASEHASAVFALIYRKLSASTAPPPQKPSTIAVFTSERTATNNY